MAVKAENYFANATVGIPQIGADLDIYETTTTPRYAVGLGFTRSDGAQFRYCHFGAAVSGGGLIVAQDVSESGTAHSATESRVYASGSVTAIAGETINPGTLGSHYVQIKGGGISADDFSGGYLQITAETGGFLQYRIRGNTASASLTTGALSTYYLELYETLQQTLDGASLIRIVGSQFANLESASAATDSFVAGVTTASHAASTYGWVQRSGLAGVRTDASGLGVGSMAAISLKTAGVCAFQGGVGKTVVAGGPAFRSPVIGYGVGKGTTAAVNLAAIDLQLE